MFRFFNELCYLVLLFGLVAERAADWFNEAMTKKKGHWMLVHSGPGFSNTKGSSEVHWRNLKEGVISTAGKAWGKYGD